MKINEAIAGFSGLVPHPYPDATLVRWLSDCDGMLFSEALHGQEGTLLAPDLPYDAHRDMDRELLVPEPYCDLYLKYLEAQVDYYAGEYARYNNAIAVYNAMAERFASAHVRTAAQGDGTALRTGVR